MRRIEVTMTAFLKTTAIAGLLALGAGMIGQAQAASLTPAPLAAAVAGFETSDLHLVGGRHWHGHPPRGGHWHRHHGGGGSGAAIALGAAGAIIGLSALAAANAQPYAAPPPPAYAYGAPAYIPEAAPYAYEEEDYATFPPEPDYSDDEDYVTGSVEPYAPPPPPLPRRSAPQNRTVASVDTASSRSPEPWSQEWFRYCSDKYRSFNPQTGYYKTYAGEQKFCR